MKNTSTRFTATRRSGSQHDQGPGGGDKARAVTSARGADIAAVADTKSTPNDHLVPRREDVAPRTSVERGGHSRTGHQKHNPASARGNAGDHMSPRDPGTKS